jgi:hypothetical protein
MAAPRPYQVMWRGAERPKARYYAERSNENGKCPQVWPSSEGLGRVSQMRLASRVGREAFRGHGWNTDFHGSMRKALARLASPWIPSVTSRVSSVAHKSIGPILSVA